MRRWTTTRRLLALAIAVFVALAALSACGGGSDDKGASTTPTVEAGTPDLTPGPTSPDGTASPDATDDGSGGGGQQGASNTPAAPGRDQDNEGRRATAEAASDATEDAEDAAERATEDAEDERGN